MSDSQSILLNHLPGIYHSSNDLVELLNIFEEVLFGEKLHDEEYADSNGLHEVIGLMPLIDATNNLSNPYFNQTNKIWKNEGREFLNWLSEWVAISQPYLFDDQQLRKLIANAITLYSKRGTREYLINMLTYIGINKDNINIYDQGLSVLEIGHTSEIGLNTRLGNQPFLFKVHVRLDDAERSTEELRHLKYRAHSVIRLAKPAHTLFELEFSDRVINENELTQPGQIETG